MPVTTVRIQLGAVCSRSDHALNTPDSRQLHTARDALHLFVNSQERAQQFPSMTRAPSQTPPDRCIAAPEAPRRGVFYYSCMKSDHMHQSYQTHKQQARLTCFHKTSEAESRDRRSSRRNRRPRQGRCRQGICRKRSNYATADCLPPGASRSVRSNSPTSK